MNRWRSRTAALLGLACVCSIAPTAALAASPSSAAPAGAVTAGPGSPAPGSVPGVPAPRTPSTAARDASLARLHAAGAATGAASPQAATVGLLAPRWPGFVVLPYIKGNVQLQANWCGPAAEKTVLTSYGINANESDIAVSAGTDVLGTLPWLLAQDITRRSLPYSEVQDLSATASRLYPYSASRINDGIDATILAVWSYKIWYPGASKLEVHYLVATGYSPDWNGTGPTWQVWDPAGHGAYHHLSAKDWGNVAFDGLAVTATW